MRTRYFEWLLSLIPGSSSIRGICNELFNMTFTYDDYHGTDGNRADDGLSLRSLYFNETRSVTYMEDCKCTVLEMLIALSLRIERDIMGEPGDDHPEKWFFEMLDNLGVFNLTSPKFVGRIVEEWMNRDFDPNGYGSIFPLKYYPGDQRDLLIWDQMSFYLNENY